MNRGEVVKAGYLTKSPPESRQAIAQWQRRWFVLSDSHRVYPLAARYVRMEYYHSEEDAGKLKNPKGIINLENCSKVTNRENMRGYKHVFDVCTSERKYHLVADSEVEKHDWIDTLNTTLFAGPSQAQSAVAPHNPSHDPSTNSRQQPTQHHQVQAQRTEFRRPLSFSGDISASKPSTRPLPSVPGSSPVSSRPLPSTPPERVTTPTRYKRPSDTFQPASLTPSAGPTGSPVPHSKHHLVHQTKSTSAVQDESAVYSHVHQTKSASAIQDGPDLHQLSLSPRPVDHDYANLEADAPAVPPHSSHDYQNLDNHDYDDTATGSGCVYEQYVPQPGAAPISMSRPAPISLPRGKGTSKRGYMNVENSATVNSADYSLIEHEPTTTSDEYSMLEVVHSKPSASRDDDYSRLELTGHLDLPPPRKPPQYNGRNVDYENLAHVAHPDTGDYSNLQH